MTRAISRLTAIALLLCCAASTGQARAADAAREIVFGVQSLGCTMVDGVGCGHLLAPLLAELDRGDGVARSSANWTGTRLCVTVAPAADTERVAAAVRATLADKGYEPARVTGDDLAKALAREEWRGVDRVAELSDYEFHTTARRRLQVFAQNEHLEKTKSDALLRLADDLWQKSGDDKTSPPSDEEGYRAYWNRRVGAFKESLLRQVKQKGLLTADQLTRLTAEARRARGEASSSNP